MTTLSEPLLHTAMKNQTSPYYPVILRVLLRTTNAARLADFYQKALGLVPRRESTAANTTSLVHPASGETLLTLVESPTSRPAPAGAPGLFHTAFLYPDLDDWVSAVSRVTRLTQGLSSASDHGVSWAFYFSDPDGNGIELAWDKPVDEWRWHGDRIQMTSLPLPLNSILMRQVKSSLETGKFQIGHLHLQVADLNEAGYFNDLMDLHVTQSSYPGALFMARGSYHHHFAINTWRARPHAIHPENATGLAGWEVARSDGSTHFIDYQKLPLLFEAE